MTGGHMLAVPIMAVIGICLGSFATALYYRVPRGISWITASNEDGRGAARSACPSCGHTLGRKDLVPLLSYLSTRGKCRYCGSGICAVYPLMEIATLLLTLLIHAFFGAAPAVWPLYAALPFFVADIAILASGKKISMSVCVLPLCLAALFAALRFWE